jgi:hypothetical protein
VPAVQAAENALDLAPGRRNRVVWRADGGAGSDKHVRWLLGRGYQVMMKGMSGRRACKLARQVTRWDPYGDVWLGWVAPPVDFGRPVRFLVKKRLKKGRFVHSYYMTSLKYPSKTAFMDSYNARGGAEVEQFRNDKSGLHLDARRKRRFLAQTALILLSDLAHNLLAHFHHHALVGTRFEPFDVKRIIRDLMAIPGRLICEGSQLKSFFLLDTHPYAEEAVSCLKNYFS